MTGISTVLSTSLSLIFISKPIRSTTTRAGASLPTGRPPRNWAALRSPTLPRARLFSIGIIDGDEDLFVANGHMDDNVELFEETTHAQWNQMFRNDGGEGFAEVDAGLWAQESSRGTVVGDYDDDGDLDVAVVHINARASLMRNNADGHWLAIRLAGGLDGVGARVSVRTGDRVQVREASRGGSYLSIHDPRLYFGLGEWTKVDAVEIRWSGGAVPRIAGVAADQLLVVEERP